MKLGENGGGLCKNALAKKKHRCLFLQRVITNPRNEKWLTSKSATLERTVWQKPQKGQLLKSQLVFLSPLCDLTYNQYELV